MSETGEGAAEQPGVYGPQFSTSLFWIVLVLLLLLIISVLVLSLHYFYKSEKSVQPGQQAADEIDEIEEVASEDNRTTISPYIKLMSIQHALKGLTATRTTRDTDFQGSSDLKIVNGMRVLCLLWVLTLGICQFTMSSAVQNPWTL